MKIKHLLTSAILPLLLLFSASLPAQPIDWDGVRQAYIDKYQPQQMPAWLFPVIIKNGLGEKDTVYLGYDPDATSQNIQIFGTTWEVKPKDGLLADLGSSTPDKILRMSIKNYTQLHMGPVLHYSIEMGGDYFPLTFYFNYKYLYDTVLPFPDTISPRVQGHFICESYSPSYQNCSPYEPIYITDNPHNIHMPALCDFTPRFPFGHGGVGCRATDSIVLYGPQTERQGTVEFWFFPYGQHLVGIEEMALSKIQVYPNPVNDLLFIENRSYETYNYRITNIQGVVVGEGVDIDSNLYSVDLSGRPNGIYLIKIFKENSFQTYKFIKM